MDDGGRHGLLGSAWLEAWLHAMSSAVLTDWETIVPMTLRDAQRAADFAAVGSRLLSLDATWTERLADDPQDPAERELLASIGLQMADDLSWLKARTSFIQAFANEIGTRLADDSPHGEYIGASADEDVRGAVSQAAAIIAEGAADEIAELLAKAADLAGGMAIAGDLTKRMWGAVSVVVGAAFLATSPLTGPALPVLLAAGAAFLTEGLGALRPD